MNCDLPTDLMKQSEELMQAERYEEALAILQEGRRVKNGKLSESAYVGAVAKYVDNLAFIDDFTAVTNIFQQSLVQHGQSFEQKIHTLSIYIKALRKMERYQKVLPLFLDIWLQLEKQNRNALFKYLERVLDAKKEDLDKAFEIYDCWSKLEPGNSNVFYSYAMGAIKIKRYEKAYKPCEKFLELCPQNFKILSEYVNILIKSRNNYRALELLYKAKLIDPNNADINLTYLCVLLELNRENELTEGLEEVLHSNPSIVENLVNFCKINYKLEHLSRCSFQLLQILLETSQLDKSNINVFVEALRSYSNFLFNLKDYEQAKLCLEKALNICSKDVAILTMYAKTLAALKQYEKAFEVFETCLELDSNDVITLNSYGKALSYAGEHLRAFLFFEKALRLQPDNIITLTNYAEALGVSGDYSYCFDIFEQALRIKPDDVITLTKYISFSMKSKKYNESLLMLKKLIEIEPGNINALNKYAFILTRLCKYEEACEIYKKSLNIEFNSNTAFKYAQLLEKTTKYQEAIRKLTKIKLNCLPQYHANVVRLTLGRLYYRVRKPEKGNEYFENAIAHSDDKECTLLYSARSILASDPHSETAIEMLQQIAEDSPRYAQALEMLTLNISEEGYFEMVRTDTQDGLNSTEMLNRAMYHKIANEISLLKGIAYRILRRSAQEEPLLTTIIQDIEDVFIEVEQRRAAQKTEIETILHDDYGRILAVISKTAHDISDFVNNQLAVIESKTRRAMRKLKFSDDHYNQFEKLLAQLELTQTALSDLKAINEGITIRKHRFKVKQLFEKWQVSPRIDSAQIILDIQNGDSEFNGDEEKIKSALNELVENSLKHNSDQYNLTIRITSQDVVNPPGIWGRTIPGEQKFLFIEFTDNGKGIPEDKKDWIFQPLKTTSQEGKGSGLGLFIIRKTLIQMNGYIRETGYDGAKFEIYIPYQSLL